MSQWMGIRLRRERIPDGLVPERAGYGNGQGIPSSVEELSEFCARVGLTPLGHFLVDDCALVEQALKAAGWVEPESREEEVTGADPAGAEYFTTRWEGPGLWKRYAVYRRTDAEYLASQAEYARIVAEVERGKPWFDPSDGLRTVRGLLELIEGGVPRAWREEATDRLRGRLIAAGLEPEMAASVYPSPIGEYQGPVWDLRTFALELDYAARKDDLFHFIISY